MTRSPPVLGLFVVGVLGCSPPEVAIVGECHIAVADVAVQLPTPTSGTTHNIGVLDRDLLVQWNVVAPSAPIDLASDVHIDWVDSSGSTIGAAPTTWQSSDSPVSRWVREGDHLAAGMILSRVDGSYSADVMNAWAVSSSPTVTRRAHTPVAVALPPDCPSCPSMALGSRTGRFPAVPVRSTTAFVLAGATTECSTLRVQEWRVIPFTATHAPAVLYPDDPCSRHEPGGAEYDPAAPELVALPSALGVLVSAGSASNPDPHYGYHGEYMFATLDRATLATISPFRTVAPASSAEGADQPRAALAGDRILFLTPVDVFPCFRLHTMNLDGTDSHDAAWQPSCNHDASLADINADIFTLDGAALLVWEHRSRADTVTAATLAATAQEVDAVLLTSLGQRGSEILRVTPSAAWSFTGSPATLAAAAGDAVEFSSSFGPRAALDGDRIVASWVDNRAAAAMGETHEQIHFAELGCTLNAR